MRVTEREGGLVSEKEKGSHVTDLGSKPVERGDVFVREKERDRQRERERVGPR